MVVVVIVFEDMIVVGCGYAMMSWTPVDGSVVLVSKGRYVPLVIIASVDTD